MIEEKSVDKSAFHFILIRENKIAAFIQRGSNDEQVAVELSHGGDMESIMAEINSTLLSEPFSSEMTDLENWGY